MQVSEIFYSVQGEGGLTGIPSVFIRTSGCNLRCSWCDTKYASWAPEARELERDAIVAEALRHPGRHIVLTGGEPTVASGIHELAAALRAHGRHLTIETNGTVTPNGLAVDLASISPKLRNSVPDSRQYPREAGLQTEARRWNLAALRAWVDGYDYQLKFVVTSGEDVAEIQELLVRLERNVPPDRVMLMPEGVDTATIRARDADLVAVCKQHGYRYCRRLHIELFGNKRGT